MAMNASTDINLPAGENADCPFKPQCSIAVVICFLLRYFL
jgi:hypothetical protein